MAQILFFSRARSWRRDDPKAEAIRIGDGSVKANPSRGHVTIEIVIPVLVAPETPVRFEEFVPASHAGGMKICEPVRRYDRERRDESRRRRHEKFNHDWKSRSRDGHQWARHPHRFPLKRLTGQRGITESDLPAAISQIAAK